jgi:HK97 family phage prohead protease
MPAPTNKVSLDEILSKRQGNIISTSRGDALVKAVKAPASWDPENRTARFILTTESVDRYGDVVVQAGGQFDRFMDNPQALLFHNSRSWPVGTWSDVTKVLTGRPKRTEGTLNFMEEGLDEDADRAARHVAAKTIRTISIGFQPLEWESLTDAEGYWTGYKFTAWELLEASLVPIPANPQCLVKDAGGDNKMLKHMIEDVLDNWAKSPEGLLMPRAEYEAAYRTVTERISPQRVLPLEQPSAPEKKEVPAVEPVARASDAEIDSFLAQVKEGDRVVVMYRHVFGGSSAVPVAVSDTIEIHRDGQEIMTLSPRKLSAAQIDRVTKAAAAAAKDAQSDVSEESVTDLAAALVEQPPVTDTVTERETSSQITVPISVDASQVDSEITRVNGLLDGLAEKIAKIFKRQTPERIEPIVDTAPPLPSPEAIAAAKAKAASVRARVVEKGLI